MLSKCHLCLSCLTPGKRKHSRHLSNQPACECLHKKKPQWNHGNGEGACSMSVIPVKQCKGSGSLRTPLGRCQGQSQARRSTSWGGQHPGPCRSPADRPLCRASAFWTGYASGRCMLDDSRMSAGSTRTGPSVEAHCSARIPIIQSKSAVS